MGLNTGETSENLRVGEGATVVIKEAEKVSCAKMPGLFCFTVKKM